MYSTQRSAHSGRSCARRRAVSVAAGGAAGPEHGRRAAPHQRQRLVARADAPEPRVRETLPLRGGGATERVSRGEKRVRASSLFP